MRGEHPWKSLSRTSLAQGSVSNCLHLRIRHTTALCYNVIITTFFLFLTEICHQRKQFSQARFVDIARYFFEDLLTSAQIVEIYAGSSKTSYCYAIVLTAFDYAWSRLDFTSLENMFRNNLENLINVSVR